MKRFLRLLTYFWVGVFVMSGSFGVYATGELDAFLKIPFAGIAFGLPWWIGGMLGLAAYAIAE